MILLAGYYEDARSERVAEFTQALQRNVAHEAIECIQLLIEDATPADALRARAGALTHRNCYRC